ncbi:unnamed protein product [Cylindrotheca closterium]|uniref:Uncharacterized protein n=1 Tax=Cylindrotheca closterium TaxID=2856 RepID=A0AAD2G4H3_9STRA|nr:unnamed protein product [Cylindrotheca closterium]
MQGAAKKSKCTARCTLDAKRGSITSRLTCIDTTVHYRSCIPMQNLKTEPVFEALDKIFCRYNKAGFHVKTIKCDRAFIPLSDDMLDDMGVTIDPTASGDHKPTAERNNRMLKESVRVALARLPYKVVPKVITECLGRRAAELLNVFPRERQYFLTFQSTANH